MGLLHAGSFQDALNLLGDNSIKTVNLVPDGINFVPLLEK